jgi:RNA polymerase primary sigma factor
VERAILEQLAGKSPMAFILFSNSGETEWDFCWHTAGRPRATRRIIVDATEQVVQRNAKLLARLTAVDLVTGEPLPDLELAEEFDRVFAKIPIRKRERREVSLLECYIREINKTALLSGDEEKELAHRIEAGDNEARHRMVRANLRLVVSIARAYIGRGLELEDLIEEGNTGLLYAVEGFDSRCNTRFSTYASYWIRSSIQRSLRNIGKTIRIPAYMVEVQAKWRRATAKLKVELGRAPTHEEVAKSLNVSKKASRLMRQAEQAASCWPLDDMVMDGNSKSPDLEMVETDDLKHVLELLDKMDPREATVLRMRFGLVEGEEAKTLKEIGECLGLTRERVRQIENEALARLRERMQADQ